MMITKVFKPIVRWCLRLVSIRLRIEIDPHLWRELVVELGRRGQNGLRESGAFLLSRCGECNRRVDKVVYFDDLDPYCLVGHIHIRSTAFTKLWDLCELQSLRVIGDIHTHPGSSVRQSETDRQNPMIARHGHIALIVPYFGTRQVSVREVGVHEYRGDLGWITWIGRSTKRVFQVRKMG